MIMFYGEPLIVDVLLFGAVGLLLAAWIYMYRQGASGRDFIFWGPIAYFIPVLGPIAVFVYFRHRSRQIKMLA